MTGKRVGVIVEVNDQFSKVGVCLKNIKMFL